MGDYGDDGDVVMTTMMITMTIHDNDCNFVPQKESFSACLCLSLFFFSWFMVAVQTFG